MSRALPFLSVLCAASLLGNIWLYRELRVRDRASASTVAVPVPQAASAVLEAQAPASPLASVASTRPKPAVGEMMDKCRKKFEEEMRRQFRDPTRREILKKTEIQSLNSMNLGAQVRLNLSDATFARILELQAEQDLAEREASIGQAPSRGRSGVNQQIAAEFGETVAAQWANYLREGYGRMRVQGLASLLGDANLPLSVEQRQRLVTVYSDEFEMQRGQGGEFDSAALDGDGEGPSLTSQWFERQQEKRMASEQRIEANAAAFLTPAQLELMRKKSDLESEQYRSMIESMRKVAPVGQGAAEGGAAAPSAEC